MWSHFLSVLEHPKQWVMGNYGWRSFFLPLSTLGRGVRLDAVETEIFWWCGQRCLFEFSTLISGLPADMRGFLPPSHGCVSASETPQLVICRGGSVIPGYGGGWEPFSLCTVLMAFFKKPHVTIMITLLVQLVFCRKVLLEKCSNTQKKNRSVNI